jgi:Flp pilus assembly protein, secretin CpaC
MDLLNTRAGLAGLLLALLTVPAAAEEPVVVNIDEAKVMRIAAPASTVIIGNPSIADATMQDTQTLVITGRGYGTTNFIVLDADGQPITDAQIRVEGADSNIVTVFRRGAGGRATYSCGAVCEPVVMVGDNGETYFDPLVQQLQKRNTNAVSRGGVQ